MRYKYFSIVNSYVFFAHDKKRPLRSVCCTISRNRRWPVNLNFVDMPEAAPQALVYPPCNDGLTLNFDVLLPCIYYITLSIFNIGAGVQRTTSERICLRRGQYQGLYLTGVRGFDPSQEVADPQKVLQNLFGGSTLTPLRTSRFHFLAKPVYLCTTIRRLRLYRGRRDLI